MPRAQIGKNNPMFGKHHSAETKNKISLKAKGKKLSEEHKRKIGRKGSKNPHWRGGIIKRLGYIFIYQPNHPFCNNHGYVRRSRLVMEKILGRYLKPEEVVHHINGVKDDDRPENLQLFENNKAHIQFHKFPKDNLGQFI